MTVTVPTTWRDTDYFGNTKCKPRILSGPSREDCFAQFFRQNNQWKYCLGTYLTFDNPQDAADYKVWISNINNYVANGGDMV